MTLVRNTNRLKFKEKAFVPYPVKCYAYVAKQNTNWFTLIKRFTECAVFVNELIYCTMRFNAISIMVGILVEKTVHIVFARMGQVQKGSESPRRKRD